MVRNNTARHQPPAAIASSPSHMVTSSILIQTDDGRRFDYSIQHNRIVDDPIFIRRKSRFLLKPILGGLAAIAAISYLLISENVGFSSFPLVVTHKKSYLGRVANVGRNSSSADDGAITADALRLADDDGLDDQLRGTEDDDSAQDVDAGANDFEIEEGNQSRGSNSEPTGMDDVAQDASAHASASFGTEENNQTSDDNDGWRETEDIAAQEANELLERKENNQTSESDYYSLRGEEDTHVRDAGSYASFEFKESSQFRNSNYSSRGKEDNDELEGGDASYDEINEYSTIHGNGIPDKHNNAEKGVNNDAIDIQRIKTNGEVDEKVSISRESNSTVEKYANLVENENTLMLTNSRDKAIAPELDNNHGNGDTISGGPW